MKSVSDLVRGTLATHFDGDSWAKVSPATGEVGAVVTLRDAPKSKGIRMSLKFTNAAVVCELVLEDYAKGLLDHIHSLPQEALTQVSACAEHLVQTRYAEGSASIWLVSGGQQFSEFTEKNLREVGGGLVLRARLWPVDVLDSTEVAWGKAELFVLNFVAVVVGLVLGDWNCGPNIAPQQEGNPVLALVKTRERSPVNRHLCIATHGCKCHVCGFDYEEQYGQIGAGYIEVHHLEPLGSLREGRIFNPRADLIPLCANCHRMIHRAGDPLAPIAPSELLRHLHGRDA